MVACGQLRVEHSVLQVLVHLQATGTAMQRHTSPFQGSACATRAAPVILQGPASKVRAFCARPVGCSATHPQEHQVDGRVDVRHLGVDQPATVRGCVVHRHLQRRVECLTLMARAAWQPATWQWSGARPACCPSPWQHRKAVASLGATRTCFTSPGRQVLWGACANVAMKRGVTMTPASLHGSTVPSAFSLSTGKCTQYL